MRQIPSWYKFNGVTIVYPRCVPILFFWGLWFWVFFIFLSLVLSKTVLVAFLFQCCGYPTGQQSTSLSDVDGNMKSTIFFLSYQSVQPGGIILNGLPFSLLPPPPFCLMLVYIKLLQLRCLHSIICPLSVFSPSS